MKRRLSVLKSKLEEATLIKTSTSYWHQWHRAASPGAVCNNWAGVVLSFITRCLLLHLEPPSSAEASISPFQKPSVSFSSFANTDLHLYLLLELKILYVWDFLQLFSQLFKILSYLEIPQQNVEIRLRATGPSDKVSENHGLKCMDFNPRARGMHWVLNRWVNVTKSIV